MFEPLLTRPCDRYRMVAPDYPGFGHGEDPNPEQLLHTHERNAQVMDAFTQALGQSR